MVRRLLPVRHPAVLKEPVRADRHGIEETGGLQRAGQSTSQGERVEERSHRLQVERLKVERQISEAEPPINVHHCHHPAADPAAVTRDIEIPHVVHGTAPGR